jgi:hypothetical protein
MFFDWIYAYYMMSIVIFFVQLVPCPHNSFLLLFKRHESKISFDAKQNEKDDQIMLYRQSTNSFFFHVAKAALLTEWIK